jgi:hypothetical protein
MPQQQPTWKINHSCMTETEFRYTYLVRFFAFLATVYGEVFSGYEPGQMVEQ